MQMNTPTFTVWLRQLWVIGTMKVARLLVVFTAIVTLTPWLTRFRAGYILGTRSQTKIGPIS